MNENSSAKGFLTSIFKYSIATYINFFIYGISILLVAWFVDTAVWGQLDIFISTSTLIMNICMLGLDNSFIRFFNEPAEPLDSFSLFSACLGLSSISLIITGVLSYLLFPEMIIDVFFSFNLGNVYVLLLFFNAFMNMIARYINILYRMQGSIRLYTIQSVLMQFFARLFFLFGAVFSAEFSNLVLWAVGGTTAFSLVFLFSVRNNLTLKKEVVFSKANRQIVPYGLAIAPTAVMLWLNSLYSKVYIDGTLGSELTGVFSMVSLLSNVIAIIQAGFATFWSAYIYANYKNEQEKIKQVHDYLTLLILVFFCLLVAFEDIIFFFLSPSYKVGMEIFPIMVLVPVFLIVSETTVYGIAIAKKPIFDTIGIALSVVTNIGLCIVLTNNFGLYGAAMALAGSNIIMFLFRTFVAQIYYKSIPSYLRTTIALTLLLIITALSTYYSHNFIMKFIVCILGIVAYIILYLNQVKEAVTFIKDILKSFTSKNKEEAGVKLIISDLDGTLLNEEHKVPDEFYDVLEELNQRDIVFAVASGRNYLGLRHLFNEKGDDIYFICDNGAFVKHGEDIVSSSEINKDDYERIINFLFKNDIDTIMICGVKGTYYQNTNDEEFNDRMRGMYTKTTLVDNIIDIDDEIFKISVYNSENVRHRVFNPLKSRFEEEFSIHISAKVWVDVMTRNADKGKALKVLQNRMGISENQTMAFGDFDNDIPMLQNAKYSFAMQDASETVKKVAAFTAKSNAENGVIIAIKEHVLEK